MTTKFLRTSDLARAVGIHPNTVRLYVDWGLIPPVERSPSGYRRFTQQHLDCLRLARMIYASEYPGRELRASSNEIIQRAVADDWTGALEKAREHLAAVKAELKSANQAANLLEHWAQNMAAESDEEPLAMGEVSKLLGVSMDVHPQLGAQRTDQRAAQLVQQLSSLRQKGYRTPADHPHVEPRRLQSHGDAAHVHRTGWGKNTRLEKSPRHPARG